MKRIIIALVAVWLLFAAALPARADVYMFKDKQGVLTFTNVPNHIGYKRILRDSGVMLGGSAAAGTAFDELISSASGRYNVDPDLIRAVIKTESDFNSNARSHKGAMGLMQLMPDTARLHNVSDAYNPNENVDGGVRHLRMLLERYQGNFELSLAAYNAGAGAVEKHGGIPPYNETREYVRKVLRFYDAFRGTGLNSLQQARQ
jgi:soluble lytic murein transglycosylase-like protein